MQNVLSTDEIENKVSKIYHANQEASMQFTHEHMGEIHIEIEKFSWFSLIKSQYHTREQPLYVDLYRTTPMVLMLFQMQGKAHFLQKEKSSLLEQHHSLNYFPHFQSKRVVGHHEKVHDMAIKLDPMFIEKQLDEEGINPEDCWPLNEGQQAYVTINQSRLMNLSILETLGQIVNCPYQGALEKMYKESLVKILLIHQMMVFRQAGKEPGLLQDHKLNNKDMQTLKEIKQYLDAHYLTPHSLGSIAKEFGLNTFKLKYGFRKLFETSVMRYVDEKKMEYARQLLLDTEQTIMDIADSLGYNHANNFSAAFKRKFGYSPARLKMR